MTHSDLAILRNIVRMHKEFINNGKPIEIVFEDVNHVIDNEYIVELLQREKSIAANNSKGSKGSKKSKAITPEVRKTVIDNIEGKVKYAFGNLDGFKVSSSLSNMFLTEIRKNLSSRRDSPKNSTLAPRLLFKIADPLADFIKGINLGLMENNVKDYSAEDRAELTKLEKYFMDYLASNQIGASTVLNALLIQYTNNENLRVSSGENKSHIKLDARLKKLLESPINSVFKGKSYADKYSVKTLTKKIVKNGKTFNIKTLASYRLEFPEKSVRDYLLYVATESGDSKELKTIEDGYLMSKHIMSLISAHLISTSLSDEMESEMFSMEMVDGHFVNPNVNALIALQSLLTATTREGSFEHSPIPARSPSRSPSARTPSRGRHNRGKSPSRGRR